MQRAKPNLRPIASYNDTERSCPAQFNFEGLDALVYIRFSVEIDEEKERNPNKEEEEEEKPHKIPLLGKITGPKFELFKT